MQCKRRVFYELMDYLKWSVCFQRAYSIAINRKAKKVFRLVRLLLLASATIDEAVPTIA